MSAKWAGLTWPEIWTGKWANETRKSGLGPTDKKAKQFRSMQSSVVNAVIGHCCVVMNVVVCVLYSHAVDRQILTNGRRHRVCYESADRPLSVANATHSLCLRCTDIYVTDDVSMSLSTSERQRSVAQLCCSVLNPRLAQFNVQPATPLELRISLHRAMVSIANANTLFVNHFQ